MGFAALNPSYKLSRNAGQSRRAARTPDFASLHPGYAQAQISSDDFAHPYVYA